MGEVILLRRGRTALPPRICPHLQRRVALALEAADEATLAGFYELRDRMIDIARAEIEGVRSRAEGAR